MKVRSVREVRDRLDLTMPDIGTGRKIQSNTIAGIPAHNEVKFIGDVVRRTTEYVDEVIVVDDGSTDDTSRVAKLAGAMVIKHKHNGGAGKATETLFAIAKRKGARSLITLDGDGQHNPDEIPQLLAPILKGEADLVIGSRFYSDHRSMPAYRKFGIQLINLLFNIGSRVKISDTQCCFRAYGERAIQHLDISEPGFTFSIEILLQAVQKGLTIREVPTSCIYHADAHNLNPVVHGLGIALNLVKLRLAKSWDNLVHTSRHEKDEAAESYTGE
jgi:glycosyltransferase involved in cell wall biosynthesis